MASLAKYPYLTILCVAALAFVPFLGSAPLFDWDEINFAESAREMIVSGNYFQVQINYQPFWEKPPLFIWLQVGSMKLFGINEFAARFPNALVGIVTLLVLFSTGRKLHSDRLGWIVSGLYFISFLPHLYFKSGIIDPLFNLFIFSGLLNVMWADQGNPKAPGSSHLRASLAGLLVGLGTLTKGPVALLVVAITYGIYKAIWSRSLPWKAIGVFTLVYLVVILSWFGSLAAFTPEGFDTVRKFIVYQVELFMQPVAGHEQPFFYHFVVFALGCFPLSSFSFRGMAMKSNEPRQQVAIRIMTILFWVVMVLFTIVRTKIIHYSSLLYFPGAVLAGYWVLDIMERRQTVKWDQKLLFVLGFLLFGGGSMLVGVVAANIEWVAPLFKGEFARAALSTKVAWTGWEFLPGLTYCIATAMAAVYLWRAQMRHFLAVLAMVMPFYTNGINALILPRIADYTQQPAIRFLKQVGQEDAYVMVEGHKSYAHYFYASMMPFPHPEIPLEKRGDWMARGPVDKPVYLLARVDKVTPEFENVWFEHFQRVGSDGGFVFFKREPESNPKLP